MASKWNSPEQAASRALPERLDETGSDLAGSRSTEGNRGRFASSCITWQPNRKTAECWGESLSSGVGISEPLLLSCSGGSASVWEENVLSALVISWRMLIACVDCVSAPLWRCWEEIAVEKSCKRRCISCRVLNSGDMLTSSDRSWSLKQGAVLCKWSAGQINTPHKRGKQSYLLEKSSKLCRSVFLTGIERKSFWFSKSHWWKLLTVQKGIIYSYLFQSEWL